MQYTYVFPFLLLLVLSACDSEPGPTDGGGATDGAAETDSGSDVTLTVAVGGAGTGTVTSDPAGIDCGSECEVTVPRGTVITLTATAGDASLFAQWVGACEESTETSCTLTLDADRTVTATFGGRRFDLSVTLDGDGDSTVTSSPAGIECGGTCTGSFVEGREVTLTATPGRRTIPIGWEGAACTGLTCALTVTADATVTFNSDGIPAVILSDTDIGSSVALEPNGLSVSFERGIGEESGVRSEASVASGSGVHYFEVTLHTMHRTSTGFGIGTADAPLELSYVGADADSYGVVNDGVNHGGEWIGRVEVGDTYGLVVDYRAASPTVHIIAQGETGSTLERSDELTAITAPVFIYLSGAQRRIAGPEMSINTGHDITHHPFVHDAEAVLRASSLSDVADALVVGWGGNFAPPEEASPEFNEVTPDMTVAAGTEVTVSATISDAESGNLTEFLQWEVLSSPYNTERIASSGGSITYTPNAVGRHLVRGRITDPRWDQVVERVVTITVESPVAQAETVRLELEPGLSGEGIALSTDGLRARWTGFAKMGVRANQSLYGEFWYFEARRLHEVAERHANQGAGLTIGGSSLNPYDQEGIGASMSINVSGGSWQNLIPIHNLGLTDSDEYYGFAVDYRGEHPIVYMIIDDVVENVLELEDVTTEVYPMLFGDPYDDTADDEFDAQINFGATAFHYDPAAALTEYGVSTAEFEAGWGDANTD